MDEYIACAPDSYNQLPIGHLYLDVSEAFQAQYAQNLKCYLPKLLITVTDTTMPSVNQTRNTEAIFNSSIVLMLYIHPNELS